MQAGKPMSTPGNLFNESGYRCGLHCGRCGCDGVELGGRLVNYQLTRLAIQPKKKVSCDGSRSQISM